MSDKTAIEWTDATWNPVTGCDQVSAGCDHCYAKALAERLWPTQYAPNADGSPRRFEDVRVHPDRLMKPLGWRSPRRVFVNSMSDLFHRDVPDEFIADVFATMYWADQHVYQVLTKRPGRMASLLSSPRFGALVQEAVGEAHLAPPGGALVPLPNVWLGTSVEDQRWANVRVPRLLSTPAAVRFLSVEPLLDSVSLARWLPIRSVTVPMEWERVSGARSELHWVIVGGESGPEHRPIDPYWVRLLRDQCVAAEVPFFFKQWGGRTPKAGGRELDGRTWDEMPERPQ